MEGALGDLRALARLLPSQMPGCARTGQRHLLGSPHAARGGCCRWLGVAAKKERRVATGWTRRFEECRFCHSWQLLPEGAGVAVGGWHTVDVGARVCGCSHRTCGAHARGVSGGRADRTERFGHRQSQESLGAWPRRPREQGVVRAVALGAWWRTPPQGLVHVVALVYFAVGFERRSCCSILRAAGLHDGVGAAGHRSLRERLGPRARDFCDRDAGEESCGACHWQPRHCLAGYSDGRSLGAVLPAADRALVAVRRDRSRP
mmetsp:Transcript_33744/g.93224  ORF Transcript_33744/g.93224 Transcript_33744/m.93224 type:complete len:261 (+) Transcript_33744:165-947(+)